MARTWVGVVAAVGVLAAGCLLAGCAGDDPKIVDAGEGGSSSATTAAPVPSVSVQFRPVFAVGAPDPTGSCDPGDLAGLDGATVNLPQCEDGAVVATYELGPVVLDGAAIESAKAGLGQGDQWIVNPTFREGPDGIEAFNAAAGRCYAKTSDCPTGQLAVVLDDVVVSAPSINEPAFERDQIQISGSFTEHSARALAAALSAG